MYPCTRPICRTLKLHAVLCATITCHVVVSESSVWDVKVWRRINIPMNFQMKVYSQVAYEMIEIWHHSRVKMLHDPQKLQENVLWCFSVVYGLGKNISKVGRNWTTRKGINVTSKKMAANVNKLLKSTHICWINNFSPLQVWTLLIIFIILLKVLFLNVTEVFHVMSWRHEWRHHVTTDVMT